MAESPTATENGSLNGAFPTDELLPVVYQELRRMAAAQLSRESAGQTLQPTALVHEAWIRLSDDGNVSWKNRAHFFGAAAQAMRRILVECSRRKAALKRRPHVEVAGMFDAAEIGPSEHILLIDESLDRLEAEDPEAARIVLLKFFSGLGTAEIAEMTGSSLRTVERRWAMAKARLYQMIREQGFYRDIPR